MTEECDVCGCELDSEGLCENHCLCPSCNELTKEGYCENCDIDYNEMLNEILNSLLNRINR